jgi:co-chaperonin GroES (HSP10)
MYAISMTPFLPALQCAKADSKTAGGVLLAAESAEKPNFGTVVAVGPGQKKEGR